MTVISFPNDSKPTDQHAPDETVIAVCRDLLAQAERGEIQGLVAICLNGDMETERYRHSQTWLHHKLLLGILTAELSEMSVELNRISKSVPLTDPEPDSPVPA